MPVWVEKKSKQPNQLVLNISLLEIVADKRKKKWVLSEKDEAFKIREKKDKTIQFDEGWKVIPKNVIGKTELNMQMQANFNLVSLVQETYCKDSMENESSSKSCAAWRAQKEN
ncbi:22544_t:CDS:2 [Gigaspora margarita]|uniref:22544_t:CDS:1 n=1 Tax=Gigaspora margarita TaxID=4874 RepID=A0ABN7UM82_GIGMA|nr:22544_t:CDS:2 [Gigaspora margarita]